MSSSHLSHHPQLKKHRLENGDYPYENGHLGEYNLFFKFIFAYALLVTSQQDFLLQVGVALKGSKAHFFFDGKAKQKMY